MVRGLASDLELPAPALTTDRLATCLLSPAPEIRTSADCLHHDGKEACEYHVIQSCKQRIAGDCETLFGSIGSLRRRKATCYKNAQRMMFPLLGSTSAS